MKVAVGALYVYPVKSCKGVSLREAIVGERGISYDREWMIVDSGGKFVTQRTVPRLATIETSFENGALCLRAPSISNLSVPLTADNKTKILVKVWNDECDAENEGREAEQWLGKYLQGNYRLARRAAHHHRKSKHGDSRVAFADAYPFLVISEASLRDLNRRMQKSLPMDRFRPNIVLQGLRAYDEDSIREIKIGEVVLQGATQCVRCSITIVDQERGVRDGDEPLRTLSIYRKTKEGAVFGRNFNHVTTGTICVGDRATISI